MIQHCSSNGWAPQRRQTITWFDVDQVLWHQLRAQYILPLCVLSNYLAEVWYMAPRDINIESRFLALQYALFAGQKSSSPKFFTNPSRYVDEVAMSKDYHHGLKSQPLPLVFRDDVMPWKPFPHYTLLCVCVCGGGGGDLVATFH